MLDLVGRRSRARRRAARRDEDAAPEQPGRDVRVPDVDREQHGGMIRVESGGFARGPLRYHRHRPPPPVFPRRPAVSSAPIAKFFVNQGLVSSRTDMQNLLRPLLKQTVSYRYHRGRELIAHGTGWVERIVVDDPETSTYFTPISISPERRFVRAPRVRHPAGSAPRLHPRPGRRAGDHRVRPVHRVRGRRRRPAPSSSTFDTSGFVQMELQGLEDAGAATDAARPARCKPEADAEA